jgi:hypothetical protein
MRVVEIYKSYQPPFDVSDTVQRLLDGVPERYQRGLHSVVVRNTDSLPRARRRAATWSGNRKYQMNDVLGMYHQAYGQDAPYIELFIDKILIGHRAMLLRLPIMRELVLSRVLFHELGHHIHLALEPVYADKEEIADYWQAVLGRQFFRGRYWYAYPFFYLVHYSELLMQRLRRRP